MHFKVLRSIEWGDCDAAGIVFYPNYFRWMDAAFHEVCSQLGFSQRSFQTDFGCLGTPLVASTLSFKLPATYGEQLSISLEFVDLSRASFGVSYVFERGNDKIASGREDRVFVRKEENGRIAATAIPDAFRQSITAL